MIGRLFSVLVLGWALVIAASWNGVANGSAATASGQASRPQMIMTVAIEPDPSPPLPSPVPPARRSSQERLIAQN